MALALKRFVAPQYAPSATFRDKWISNHARREEYLKLSDTDPRTAPLLPLAAALSARSGLGRGQIVLTVLTLIGLAFWLFHDATGLSAVAYWGLWFSFISGACLRFWCSTILPVRPARDPYLAADNENLPVYSVIVALYRESTMAAQLVRALRALDYPPERLEVILALEACDHETRVALETIGLPAHMRILIVPEGTPRTKPRALNHALNQAKGSYVAVYDAEDMPHPHQLREAVSRFAAADKSLVCLQAPLRPLADEGFVARQFAAEYAVQFEIILPAFTTLGLPLPLGGTSNHFHAPTLKAIGGWDAWNVTEDADLGMRLGCLGYDAGMLEHPTYEIAPVDTKTWIPQRTRWIKGYIQTLIVHTRSLTSPNGHLRPRLWLSLFLGVGLSILSALAYGPFTLLVIARLLLSALSQEPAHMAWLDLLLFTGGAIIGMLALSEGAKRSLTPFKGHDLLMAPFYWCLTSVAAIFALGQLLTRPFHWDKTEHQPLDTDTASMPPMREPTQATA
jgi:glycosyltransferase XagB